MRFLKQCFKIVVFKSKKVSKYSSFGNNSIIYYRFNSQYEILLIDIGNFALSKLPTN